MAKNITLMGASYSDVPSILLPQTGGGTAQFYDITDAETALGSDGTETLEDSITALTTYSNEITGASDTTLSAAVATLAAGYGVGSSNLVTGTFTGTRAGEVMTVTVSYTGSGYPIAIVVYPSEGSYNTSGSFYAAIEYRAVILYCAVKNVLTTAPSYNAGSNDGAMVAVVNKNSSSDAAVTTSNRNNSIKLYTSGSASPYSADMLKINSATAMNIIMSNSAYGFAPNVEYTYHIIYSS